MSDRYKIKQEELRILYENFKKYPDLFIMKTYVEDATFLRKFGIVIPEKEKNQSAYLKLFASDFIVEEIAPNKKTYTVEIGNMNLPDIPKDKYTIFATLVKCNISTLEVVQELSIKLSCDVKDIHYAGLKDKNAITSQRISLHNVNLEKLSTLSSPYYFLKDIETGKGSIEKSGLFGNRFTILLRTDKQVNKERLNEAIEKIKINGFFNFYYLQRFGTPRLINYKWGFDILKGNYEKVMRDFLTSESIYEIEFFKQLRQKIDEQWPNMSIIRDIIALFPLIFSNEHKIIDYLFIHPGDYLGALKQIPDQTMLWVYGLGSLLFNEKLSSYVSGNENIPQELPLVLSNLNDDIRFYEKFLQAIKYYPPQFNNLLPFPHIRLMHRTNSTKSMVDFHSINITPEGITISFSLEKGEYATTMLAHIVNIISGSPPVELPKKQIDTIGISTGKSAKDILMKFQRVDKVKTSIPFEGFEHGRQT